MDYGGNPFPPGAWLYLAFFLGLPLIIFEGSEPIPALRGGGITATHQLAFLSPVLLVMLGFGGGLARNLIFFLALPPLILFQYRAYRVLQPQPDYPDPDPET